MTPRIATSTLPLLLALVAAPVAAQTIHFPDSTLANPPQIGFPFYTPGSGSTGQTVRIQFLCPDSFLSAQNLTAGLVTRVGFSLAGQAVYDAFELRAGSTNVSFLGPDWAINLPDQRVQRDLSNELLIGGGTAANPANAWVEFDLDYPFHWQPGQHIVVDLTTHIAVPGVHLGTTTANSGGIQRAYNFSYTPGAFATTFTQSGIALQLHFATTDIVTFGAGCSAPAGQAPVLSSTGAATLGGALLISADQALVGSIGGFVWGGSRRTPGGGGALPLDLGGGCQLLVSPDLFVDVMIAPGSAGGNAMFPLIVPNDPLLLGGVLYTQFAQLDPASPAIVPLTFSNGGIVVIH